MVTYQPPSASKPRAQDVRRAEQGVPQLVPAAPVEAQPLDAVQEVARLLDRVDRAALGEVRVLLLGMARAARHADLAVDAAAAGRPDLEAGRLRHDREVGAEATARAGEAADAARLLVGVGADDDVAAQGAARGQRLGRDDHRRDATLHVARPAARDDAVAHLRVERVVLPAVLATGRDDVDVPVEQQRAAAAGAAEAGHELRPTLEADALDRHGMAGDVLRRRLPDVDLRTGAAQPVGEVLLERGLLPRRHLDARAGLGVEADERAGEVDDVVPTGRDRVDEGALVGVERLRHWPSPPSSSRAATGSVAAPRAPAG